MFCRIAPVSIFLIFAFYCFSIAQSQKTSREKQIFNVSERSDTTIQKNSSTISRILAPDKGQHFLGSTFSTIFLTKFSQQHTTLSKQKSKKYSVGITLSLGIIKEMMDRQQPKNHFSWLDLLADGSGILVGIILLNQP